MTNFEKKILIHLFLKNIEPRREGYRIPLFTLKEISKITKVSLEKTTLATNLLESAGYITYWSERYYAGYFISEEGEEKIKEMLLSLADISEEK